jgi:hypothetical protein
LPLLVWLVVHVSWLVKLPRTEFYGYEKGNGEYSGEGKAAAIAVMPAKTRTTRSWRLQDAGGCRMMHHGRARKKRLVDET